MGKDIERRLFADNTKVYQPRNFLLKVGRTFTVQKSSGKLYTSEINLKQSENKSSLFFDVQEKNKSKDQKTEPRTEKERYNDLIKVYTVKKGEKTKDVTNFI